MNTPESKQIMTRFYESLDAIIDKNEIRGVATYCRLYEIDRRNFINNRKNMDLGRFELSWMAHIVKDFKVNGNWLLTGRGKMFR